MNTEAIVTKSPHYAALCKFIEGVNLKIEAYFKRNDFTFSKPDKVFVHSVGKRYAKLATYRERDNKWSASSVYCFFDLTTGDLLKGSWKAPVANGIRGNVNDKNVMDKFTEHGPAYLRG
jgi:hypothetical protein